MFFDNVNFTPNICAVLTVGWDTDTFRSDARPYHAISYRLSGGASILCDGGEIRVSTHDVLFVPAGQAYTVSAEQSEQVITVHFFSDVAPLGEIAKFTPASHSEIERCFTDMHTLWNTRTRSSELECRAALYRLLTLIERELEPHSRSERDKIDDAEAYIRSSFTSHSLNVDDLAKECGMSDTYFRHLFTERYGTTPLKYINNLRLTYARELLESHYYTVTEVSEMCGFSNINYFSTFIKKELGRSPKKIK